ncbi:MAG: TetR/AcrR family transcriptional regulator C-terminal domain-containing protein [Acidimicrobiales bacterium]
MEQASPDCNTAIGSAALTVIDRVGLFGLEPHLVAAELGSTEASAAAAAVPVDALIDLAVDALYAEVELEPTAVRWADRIRFYAHSFRGALLRHPELAYSIATRPVVSMASIRLAEHALGELTAVGFTPTHANRVLLVLVSFVTGHALTEIGASDARYGGHDPDAVADFRGSLSVDDVPLAARSVGDVDRDAEFELGLGLLVDGLERQLLHAAP